MYFTAYENGQRIHEGYGSSVKAILKLFGSHFVKATQLGRERKYVDPDGKSPVVVYIRPAELEELV